MDNSIVKIPSDEDLSKEITLLRDGLLLAVGFLSSCQPKNSGMILPRLNALIDPRRKLGNTPDLSENPPK